VYTKQKEKTQKGGTVTQAVTSQKLQAARRKWNAVYNMVEF